MGGNEHGSRRPVRSVYVGSWLVLLGVGEPSVASLDCYSELVALNGRY